LADNGSGFDALWSALLPVGRDASTGGYRRYAWSDADLAARSWFETAAHDRGLGVETDRNGNLWAWWGTASPDRPAVVTGSHLDSVPDGGAYDGPLGVVSAFAALDLLRDQGFRPGRPLAVAAFADEEGARFGVACVGSRLLAGVLSPEAARALRDADGVSLAEAMASAGHDPDGLGRDDERLATLGAYVELHVEQGRALATAEADRPVGVAAAIWPHGRYRLTFEGAADHAGTTRMDDRRDPMLTYAETVLSARKRAHLRGARATFGRVRVEPNATNAVPARVVAWLDARAESEEALATLVDDVRVRAEERAARDGTTVALTAESVSPAVVFDPALRDRVVEAVGPGTPLLPTQAGHDAGVLAAVLPTAMLFVRNPTGVSHSPAERAERADCLVGVEALARVLRAELAR
jgi:N-carbamoyl-L-amino-acid hydrolase